MKPSLAAAAVALSAAILLCACTPALAPAPASTETPAQAPQATAVQADTPITAVEQLSLDAPFSLRSQDGGAAVYCLLSEREIDEWNANLILTVDGREYLPFEWYSMFASAQLVHFADGGDTLLITVDEMSNDYGTVCWQLRDGVAGQTAHVFGMLDAVQADGTVEFSRAVDVLGTWWGARTYVLGADGSLAPQADSLYRITAYEPVVVKAGFPAEIERDGAWKAVELSAGDRLYPTATDDQSRLWFTLDGQNGRLTFSREDYAISINGVPEDALFEELRYAG